MTPEEAYDEALRRIREAENTRALELNLSAWSETAQEYSGLETLNRLPPELGRLTSLQTLNLFYCKQLSGDLSPLASLTSLQSLNLDGCMQLSGDLSPLAGLISLQSLDLSWCYGLSGDLSPMANLTSLQSLKLNYCRGVYRFGPLESLLPTLKNLSLLGCELDDLPKKSAANLMKTFWIKSARTYEDLKSGQRIDAEVKVLFLGNGGAGKTQLCRRLRDLPFDPNSWMASRNPCD
jgi:internalin A